MPRIICHKVRLDRGGYNRGGQYFGNGEPLYFYNDGTIEGYVRAPDRAAAIRAMRADPCKLGARLDSGYSILPREAAELGYGQEAGR